MGLLNYPLGTEKAIGVIESKNTIVYIVDLRATKTSIKKDFESIFNVKVERVNTSNTSTNKKKAFIKLASPYKASDVAVKLKLV